MPALPTLRENTSRPRAFAAVLALALVSSACDEGFGVHREAGAHPTLRKRYHAGRDDPNEAEAPRRSGRRVHAKSRFVWIRRSADEKSDWLGYISLGESVAVRDDVAPITDAADCRAWIPVEPEGWVCTGSQATLDASDEIVVRLEEHAAVRTSAWPYDYARSLGAPRYRGLPSSGAQRAQEGDVDLLKKRIDQARLVHDLEGIRAIDPRLAGAELGMTGNEPPAMFEPPPSVLETSEDLALGATIAYSYEFDRDGRAWLLAWDHAVIPMVRVKKYPRSAFRGVELDDDHVRLPVAFTQKRDAHRVRVAPDGAVTVESELFAKQAPIELTEAAPVVGHDGRRYRATKEPGIFVAESDVVIPTPIGEPPKELPIGGRRTWVEVSTVGGWLVAYEDRRPVYVTLISAGRARMLDDGNMAPISATPNGAYPVLSKLVTTTMRSDAHPELVHAEVMYTQVFHEGFALHGAYWHDEWGDRKSAGCVNLAPIDSKWLFDWSEPRMPTDWHAHRTEPGEPATWVVVHQ